MSRFSLLQLLYPSQCVLCAALLPKGESGVCPACRSHTVDFPATRIPLPHLESWTALWYYEGNVRDSIIRFKFGRRPSYAKVYGPLLAAKLSQQAVSFDILTWVPTGRLRKRERGYDQVELLAKQTAKAMPCKAMPTLRKIRNNPPQSSLGFAAQRRANVLGAYRTLHPEQIVGKRILLLDDVITTGATAGECARMLLTAGAKEVHLACIAAANHQEQSSR